MMSGYGWLLLFTMQFTSNGSQADDASETEHILSQPIGMSSSKEPLTLCEIRPVNADTDDNRQSIDANEHCSLVDAEQPQCRICFDSEGEDLMAPCYCRGTQKYVYRSCLDNWGSTKEGFAFSHCTECRVVFLLRANLPPDRWWLRLKFQFFVVRDHMLIFIIVQLIVAFLGMLIYKFYGNEVGEMFGYEQHPHGFYSMAVLAIIRAGLLYGFFIAIICVTEDQ